MPTAPEHEAERGARIAEVGPVLLARREETRAIAGREEVQGALDAVASPHERGGFRAVAVRERRAVAGAVVDRVRGGDERGTAPEAVAQLVEPGQLGVGADDERVPRDEAR